MIGENARALMSELPGSVQLVVAAKGRNPAEILEAVEAGVRIIGENYVRDVKQAFPAIGKRVQWHFIGIARTQKHDLLRKRAMEMFDMIETVDSLEIAKGIDRKCREIGKVMPVLVEINSGREPQKAGVSPELAEELIRGISRLKNVRVNGLMTMGPRSGNPEESRPYFKETRKTFERLKAFEIPGVRMEYLSMGMTNSYAVALQEGANVVRIGSRIFGASVCGR